MRTLKFVLAYDGSDFVGWQRQPNGPSVQAHLEAALAAIEGRPVSVTGAGRTDAGVHALGQVASCALAHPIPPDTLARALNAMLPDGIRVLSASEAPEGFHARYSARSKTYRYLILNGPLASPFARRHAWHVTAPLDVQAMSAAARLLEGEHDFAALRASGGAARTTTRTVTASQIDVASPADGFGPVFAEAHVPMAARLIRFEMTGTGFLRHMVRNAVGSLAEIGLGRRPPEWMAAVLDSRDRDQAGPTAPACGLFLVSVEYDR